MDMSIWICKRIICHRIGRLWLWRKLVPNTKKHRDKTQNEKHWIHALIIFNPPQGPTNHAHQLPIMPLKSFASPLLYFREPWNQHSAKKKNIQNIQAIQIRMYVVRVVRIVSKLRRKSLLFRSLRHMSWPLSPSPSLQMVQHISNGLSPANVSYGGKNTSWSTDEPICCCKAKPSQAESQASCFVTEAGRPECRPIRTRRPLHAPSLLASDGVTGSHGLNGGSVALQNVSVNCDAWYDIYIYIYTFFQKRKSIKISVLGGSIRML